MGFWLTLVPSATIKESEHQVNQALVGAAPSQQLSSGHLRTVVAFSVTSLQETLLKERQGWSVTEQCPRAPVFDPWQQTRKYTVL